MPRHLKCLAGDDSIRDIMRIVKEEMICEFYVDHEVNFAEIAPLPIGWIDNDVVYEDWGPQDKVGQNGNNEVNEGEEEGDIGNITQDRAIGGNKGKFGNSYEIGEHSNRGGYEEECFVDDWSSTDEEADPVDGSDRDDDEAIAVKATTRSLRRPTEGLEVPPGFKGSKTGVRKSYKGKDLIPKKGRKGDPVHPSQSVPVDNDESLYSDNDGRDSDYAPSDDAGKLRDSSTDSEDDIFPALKAADRPRKASNVYFNPTWDHTHVINVHERSCSCREWNLIGIPCSHALCALRFKDWSFEYFVDEYYKKEKYLQTYGTALECLKGKEVLGRRPEGGCLPPEMRSMPRRPRRNRRKAKDKPMKLKKGKLTKLSKHEFVYTCSVCGEQGHNKAGCP
ncbi:hypothetical protein SLEP1_g383 [Rubroshorea leprosula]|uniref:SWIM-type domain-containing protein n=1 Tax=Rubroshorea leprosula TaxID=152421 RepID=A0AAV5HA90_9ROSI|nr:hypothetical protein SLEP1_g383 [Rubroshorea leprosula]